jgi:prepilin-type processing-associated H-X9-DG protein
MQRWKPRAALAVGLAVLAGASALWTRQETDRVTRANYEKLAIGMRPADVESVLGPASSSQSGYDRLDADLGRDRSRDDCAGLGFGGLVGLPFEPTDTGPRFPGLMEQQYWQGHAGWVGVLFVDGRVAGKRWLAEPTAFERIRRQWRGW